MKEKSAVSWVKSSVAQKNLYTLPERNWKIKLNQNENPYPVPEEIRRRVADELIRRQWNRYPDLGTNELRKQLASWLNVSPDNVLVGNGSNEILLAVLMSTVSEKTGVLLVEPTFSLYHHCIEILGGKVVNLLLERSNFSFPVAQIIERLQQGDIRLAIFCSPNNPTGSRLPAEDLKQILEKTDALVLVDEAYADFCDQDFSFLLAEHPNLILTRTFSKAFAFAFGRFGYALADAALAREIRKVLLPYNVSGFTEVAAQILLEYRAHIRAVIGSICHERDRLWKELQNVPGIRVYPSAANFLLVKSEMGAGKLFELLLAQGILVRDVSGYPLLADHLRITVGTPEENDALLKTIREAAATFREG
jgi:histidinol-phosphate aminotransferase